MPFIPAVDCVKVVLHLRWNSQQVKNTLWFKNTPGGSYTNAQRVSLIANLAAWWTNFLRIDLSNELSLTAIEAINQENANAPSTLSVLSPAVPGSFSGASVSLNVAITASLRSNLRGRSYRGRNYVPGLLQTNMIDRGTFAVGMCSNIAASYAKLFDPAAFPADIAVIASHFTNKLPRLVATLTPITAIIVETLADSMRRRLIGRGN